MDPMAQPLDEPEDNANGACGSLPSKSEEIHCLGEPSVSQSRLCDSITACQLAFWLTRHKHLPFFTLVHKENLIREGLLLEHLHLFSTLGYAGLVLREIF
jgi:hypothetical protein